VVHTKEFLSAYHEQGDTSCLRLIARPPVFTTENATLDKLLALFHEKRTQMAFLVDEYGGVEGIVTLKDVVDELVGEISNE
jgi:putative hemolysin